MILLILWWELKISRLYFLKGKTVLAANNLDTRFWQLAGNLKLEDKLLYTVSDNKRAYSIKVIVWDYIIESDNKTMEKFIQMAKHLEAIKPKQKYYLSVKNRILLIKLYMIAMVS
ncbi:hypothetical protein SD457_05250 [Coprobacillaceae bacterium CR2/5/TPMF4]|nr:hypothetical protein SD457_05250 [Coprobacillaceae bacterium CR2/5/TPMF4]